MEDYPFCKVLTSHTALQFCILICILEQWSPLVLMQSTCNSSIKGWTCTTLCWTTSIEAFSTTVARTVPVRPDAIGSHSYHRAIQRAVLLLTQPL